MLIHEDPEFLKAFWAYSEVLDGPVEYPVPKYTEGSNLLNFMLSVKFFEQRQADQEGRAIFEEWRRSWTYLLAEYLRIVGQAKLRQRKIPQTPGGLTPEEATAAYWIFLFGSEELQDAFLRGNHDFRNALLYAVLKDGGIYDVRGFWCELVLP